MSRPASRQEKALLGVIGNSYGAVTYWIKASPTPSLSSEGPLAIKLIGHVKFPFLLSLSLSPLNFNLAVDFFYYKL